MSQPAAALATAAPAAALPEPVIVHSDMAEEPRGKAIALTLEALTLHKTEKDQCMHVKKGLEAWDGALWMVVIGVAFGASVAHVNHGLLMFRVGKVHCLAFRSFEESSLVNGGEPPAPRAEAASKKEGEDEEGAPGAQEAS